MKPRDDVNFFQLMHILFGSKWELVRYMIFTLLCDWEAYPDTFFQNTNRGTENDMDVTVHYSCLAFEWSLVALGSQITSEKWPPVYKKQ